MKRIDENNFIIDIANEHALVSMSFSPGKAAMPGDIGQVVVDGKSVSICQWGQTNVLPQVRELLVAENNIIPTLIKTKRDIVLGRGLYTYTEKVVDGKLEESEVEMPAEMKAFFKKINIDKYLMNAARELEFHANVFTEFIRMNGGKIDSIKSHKCTHIRKAPMDATGKVPFVYWSGAWSMFKLRDASLNRIIQIPYYDAEKPQMKFVMHTGSDILGNDYYHEPYWWGGKKWIELSNCIPDFHISNIGNGYSIRFHIEIPSDYFDDSTSEAATPDGIKNAAQNEKKRKEAFVQKLNDFLAGANNSGRALITEYDINHALGTAFPGIKITPLSFDMKDKALLELFEKSNSANVSAQGIHPTLANIETAGKLSSGTEIRNAYLMYLAISVPASRRILLEPIKEVAYINGWPDEIKIGFRDLELTSLDNNPAGSQPMNSPTNATQ